MKFISMDLVNFRQYKEAHIDFSCLDDKNVTIIMGDGGTGKTTFTQAFYWCFYNKTNFQNKVLLNYDVADSAYEGQEEIPVRVTINVEFGDECYEIRREERYEKNNGQIQLMNKYKRIETLKIVEKNGNRQFKGEAATNLIERMLPKELSKYFFFDGENMSAMSEILFNEKKSTDIASVIQCMVGLRSLQQLKKHLKSPETNKKTVIKCLNREIDDTGNGELKKISQEIDELQNKINKNEKSSEDTDKEIKNIRNEIDIIRAWLNNHENAVELQKKIEEIGSIQEEKKQRRNKKTEKIAEIMKATRKERLCNWLFKLVNLNIQQSSNVGVEDYEVPIKILKKIKSNKRCVCGCDLKEDSEHLLRIEQLIEEAEVNGKNRAFSFFKKEGEGYEERSNTNKIVTSELMDEIEQIEYEYQNLKGQIARYKEEMAGRDEEIKEKVDIQRGYEEDIVNLEERKENLLIENGEIVSQLKNKQMKRESIIKTDKENRFFEECLRMAEEVYEQIESAYGSVEKEVRNRFKECFQDLYEKIYEDGWKFDISEHYEVKPSKPLDPSTSQKYSMVLSFIGTALIMAKEKEKNIRNSKKEYMDESEQYPLVMDAPLSAFDSTRIKNIANIMPEIVQQWVIFIKDTDGVIAKSQMKDLIGKSYKIVKFSEADSRIMEGNVYGD